MDEMMKNPIRALAGRVKSGRLGVLATRQVTVGWIALVMIVVFVSVALIAYSVQANFEADREREREDDYLACVATNERRADAKEVALEDVAADRRIWLAIDDLFDNGIPEPARATIFDGLDGREALIAETYRKMPCPVPAHLQDEADETNAMLFG